MTDFEPEKEVSSKSDDHFADKVDRQLLQWRSELDHDEATLARMRSRLHEAVRPDFASATRSPEWIAAPAPNLRLKVFAYAASLGVCMLLIVACYLLVARDKSQPPVAQISPLNSDLDRGAFTPEEIRQTATIVCELDRIFEHQVHLIRQHDSITDVDLRADLAEASTTPRVILQFELQEHDSNGWRTVHIERMVGSHDHQFEFPETDGMVVSYWSHLLPDHSLWAEIQLTTPNEAVLSLRLVSNQPALIWSGSYVGRERRLLVVYQRLEPCQQGVI